MGRRHKIDLAMRDYILVSTILVECCKIFAVPCLFAMTRKRLQTQCERVYIIQQLAVSWWGSLMRGDLLCLKAAAALTASLCDINHILLLCRVTSSVDSTCVGSPLQQQRQLLSSSSQLQHSSSVIVVNVVCSAAIASQCRAPRSWWCS